MEDTFYERQKLKDEEALREKEKERELLGLDDDDADNGRGEGGETKKEGQDDDGDADDDVVRTRTRGPEKVPVWLHKVPKAESWEPFDDDVNVKIETAWQDQSGAAPNELTFRKGKTLMKVTLRDPTGGNGEGEENGEGDQKQPCKNYSKGRCKFGNKCRFSHENGGQGKEPKYPNLTNLSGAKKAAASAFGGFGAGNNDANKPMPVRRVMVSKGQAGQWEILSLRYRPPMSLRGKSALELFQKVWATSDIEDAGESMFGTKHGLGFLFLYDLFQGRQRCKIVGSSWSMWGVQSADDRQTDSFRFAVLLSQLYTDRKRKHILTSIINVMSRNKVSCIFSSSFSLFLLSSFFFFRLLLSSSFFFFFMRHDSLTSFRTFISHLLSRMYNSLINPHSGSCHALPRVKGQEKKSNVASLQRFY